MTGGQGREALTRKGYRLRSYLRGLGLTTTALVTAGVLSACGVAPAAVGADHSARPSTTKGSTAVNGGVDPRTITGPSTAVLGDEDVHPVSGFAAPRLPVQVQSYDGATVTVTSADRIVAVDMNGTLGEIVFTLGLGSHVVGRDMSTDFPSAHDVPVVTVGGHQLSAEGILALDPTVVLTDADIGPPEVQQQLRDAGIPVVFFDPERSLESVPPLITSVAAALGVPAAGAELVDRVSREITAALSMAPIGFPPLRMTFLYVRGTAGVYLMAGEGSGADSMIEAIGGVDVGTDIGLDDAFVPITSEALIAGAPDVIIVMTKGLESVEGVDGLLEIPGLAQTPAGENRRVVDMDDSVILSFGPRIGATIKALAAAVYAPVQR